MPAVSEQKVSSAEMSSARTSRAGASAATADRITKGISAKTKETKKDSEALFQSRLNLMSSLRKNLVPLSN